jgi:hypothetical protein
MRAIVLIGLVLIAYRVGHWSGEVDARQSVPIAMCPKVDARWIGDGPRRRLDTLTYIPEACR